MKIKWTATATRGKQNVASYIRRRFGDSYRTDFLQEVRETVQVMKRHPDVGPIEPLLADLPQTYRSVVVARLSKIVYFIDGDVIYIADFWDCRREPATLAGQVK